MVPQLHMGTIEPRTFREEVGVHPVASDVG